MSQKQDQSFTRRQFVQTTAALAGLGSITGCATTRNTAAPESSIAATTLGKPHTGPINVGVIGCGGRGTGAAVNALEASPVTRITALADVFPDRLNGCRQHLATLPSDQLARVRIDDDHCFTGFDAYEKLLATDVDLVILATPPGFRPAHLAAAVAARKHVFLEKPVAVDPVGIRSVLASADLADAHGLCIVAGTQRRHETCYLEAMRRIKHGDIGTITSASCYWNQGGLWMNPREAQWSDMEWQLRNWLYFTWLSGDHICEQHVHNIDVINWAVGAHPIKASGSGGRQVRTDPAYGHVFDHFAIEYEYENGVTMTSMSRQIDGCAGRVEEVIRGTKGTSITASGRAKIDGSKSWTFDDALTPNGNPYVQEHIDLINAVVSGQRLNEARAVAESTLTAIMGRLAAYTGKVVTWEQMMNSSLDLMPPRELMAMGHLPTPDVAVPGRTALI